MTALAATRRPDPLLALFDAAAALPPEAWPAFFDEQVPDPKLRSRLSRLLAAERATRHWTDEAVGVPGAQQRARERAPVDRIGPWQLGALLGAGGMGRVFAAHRADGRFAQDVAIKFLHSHRLDAVARRRFADECRLLARLGDPRIVRVLDAGELDDGAPYVVMERLHGEPLDAWVRRTAPDLRTRVALLRDVCAGVAAAHAAAIVHRDLKPGNVLVTERGLVHLLDFGIARALDEGGALTATVDRAFSADYAAPEQWTGAAADPRCDVHALGVMLFELLCGQRPYRLGELSPAAAADAVATVVARPPSQCLPPDRLAEASATAWRDLDRICAQALRKEPGQRFADAAALASALTAWLDGQPVHARRAPLLYAWRLLFARQRHWWLALGVGALVTLVSATAWWHSVDQETVAEARALAAEGLTAAQQERATRLARLTLGLIQSADPRRAPDADRPGLGWLGQLDGQIADSLAEDPELAAELAGALGTVWLSLGQPRRAVATLTPALAHEPLPAALRRELTARLLQAHVQLAAPQPARALLDALGEPADVDTRLNARIALDAAQLALIEGRSEVAGGRLRRLVEDLSTRYGPRDLLTLRARQMEIDTLVQIGRLPEAQRRNDALLAEQKQSADGNPVDTARTLWRATDLAWRLRAMGQARALARQTVAAYHELYGDSGRPLFSAMVLEANVLRAAGAPDLAEQRYHAARAVGERALGPDHPHLAQLEFNLAQLLEEDLARFDEARDAYGKALAAHARRLGDRHPTSGLIAWRLGALHLRQGQPAQALTVLEQASAALASDPARSAQVAVERSTALLALNRPGEAAAALRPARAFFDPALPHLVDPGRQERARELVSVLRALGHSVSGLPATAPGTTAALAPAAR